MKRAGALCEPSPGRAWRFEALRRRSSASRSRRSSLYVVAPARSRRAGGEPSGPAWESRRATAPCPLRASPASDMPAHQNVFVGLCAAFLWMDLVSKVLSARVGRRGALHSPLLTRGVRPVYPTGAKNSDMIDFCTQTYSSIRNREVSIKRRSLQR